MNDINKLTVAICHAAVLIGMPGIALAQAEQDPATESVISLGLGVGIAPAYLGASATRVQPVPMIFIKQGPFYLDSTRGAGYRYETPSGFFFGQALNWDPGRLDHDSDFRPGSDRLRGMGAINDALVTTAEVGYSFAPWLALRAEGEFALTGHDRGNRYSLGFEGGLWSKGKNDVWYQVYTHFSDRRFVRS